MAREQLHGAAEGDIVAQIFSIESSVSEQFELSPVPLGNILPDAFDALLLAFAVAGETKESTEELFLGELVVFQLAVEFNQTRAFLFP